MLRLSFLIIFSILSFTFASYGQVCGQGTYTINFVQKEPIKYEMFSINPRSKDINSKENKLLVKLYGDLKFDLDNWFHLKFRVKNKVAETFLRNYKDDNFVYISGTHPSQTRIGGSSENGVIKFKTSETREQTTLLKISSKKYGNFYFLGGFICGCDRTNTFDLRKNKLVD